jgi:U3 small nucleolar RNA-associated protein 14
MSAEDVRARQAELAKMRSLLFFHEMKCRRIARIKSKKFAKVHKKKHAARDSNANDDIEYEEGADVDAAEQRERQRIKERMTLKHRNTSKWVTRQLHRGGGKEKGTRQAIEQQLRLAEDLKRKVDRLSASSDDGAGGSSAEDEGVESIREGIESHESSVQQKGIHSMAFMKIRAGLKRFACWTRWPLQIQAMLLLAMITPRLHQADAASTTLILHESIRF